MAVHVQQAKFFCCLLTLVETSGSAACFPGLVLLNVSVFCVFLSLAEVLHSCNILCHPFVFGCILCSVNGQVFTCCSSSTVALMVSISVGRTADTFSDHFHL